MLCMGDLATYDRIAVASAPHECKELGRAVTPFIQRSGRVRGSQVRHAAKVSQRGWTTRCSWPPATASSH